LLRSSTPLTPSTPPSASTIPLNGKLTTRQLRPLPPPDVDPALADYLGHLWDALYQLLDLHAQNDKKITDSTAPTIDQIRTSLEAHGSSPLNVTALRGQLGEPQVASAPTLTALPALSDSSYEDGALISFNSQLYRRNRITEPGSWDAVTSPSIGSNPSFNSVTVTTTYSVGANQVVGSRKTGWGAWTGVATRSSIATGAATTQNCAEAIKALVDDLIAHGLIGA
jgi:hypothetical protein